MTNLSSDNSDKHALMRLYERMVLIRQAEERLGEASLRGTVPGAVHLSIGQEAIAVGVSDQLTDEDWMTSTHRGHGHFLAKGGDVGAMFAEIWGKANGVCRGMGGSMHVADVSKGMLGANGIVGGGFAIATGAGLAAQLDGDGRVCVCFFGEGAANQGVFMESLNVATLWKLPVIFVCENNGYSEFMKASKITAGAIADRARAFGIPSTVVDGNDVLAVAEAARSAVERARRGEGPSYLEAVTYRIRAHGGPNEIESHLKDRPYRPQEEVDAWKSPQRDPISRFRTELICRGVTEAELDALEAGIHHQIDSAVAYAEAGQHADSELAFQLMNVVHA
jgi:acetoin:2,6-dichlorophenolindophenol oxidoreductase subunit alpha